MKVTDIAVTIRSATLPRFAISLIDNPQLCIIQHDLLFAILFKLHSSNGIMCRSFHFDHFAKAKLLVFYFLTNL